MKKRALCLFMLLCLLFGTSVPAFADRPRTVDGVYVNAKAVENPEIEIKAKAVVLMDASSGTVLMATNETQSLYPASVTKIMSLILVCEAIESGKISLDDEVTAGENASSKGGSQIWLENGEKMTVRDLLKATAVFSANDACTALGEYIAGSEDEFVSLMNEKAQELGMTSTHFENCTGLDDNVTNHQTSAYDVALMSKELLSHEMITEYTTIWMDSLRGGETEIVNTNKLIRYYSGITGLKTGTTQKAGCCVSATAERNGMKLIAVVMGSENSTDRFDTAKAMLNWGFSNFESYTPEIDETQISTVTVKHGLKAETLPVHKDETEPVLLRKGEGKNVQQVFVVTENIEAPVTEGQELGKVSFILDGESIADIALTASENIDKMKISDAFFLLLRTVGSQKQD